MSLPSPQISGPRPAGPRARRRAQTTAPVTYDFRRPIQLSREHQRVLHNCFDGFARQATNVFTSVLRRICQVTLVNIDQRSYSEYVYSLGSSAYLTLFTTDPMPGRGMLALPLGAVMSCVDHMLGGPGHADQPQRPLTEIEEGVISGLVKRMLHEMRYSLEPVVALEPEHAGVEYSPQFVQMAGAADVMVVIALELKIDETAHRVSICLPFTGLLPHLATAATPVPVSTRERAQRAQAAQIVERSFQDVPIDVSIRFRTTRVDPTVLTELEVGHVVRLGHPASAPLDVTCDDLAFAHATAGAQGARLAALIVATAPREAAGHPSDPTHQELR